MRMHGDRVRRDIPEYTISERSSSCASISSIPGHGSAISCEIQAEPLTPSARHALAESISHSFPLLQFLPGTIPGAATGSRDPPRLQPSGLTLPGRPYRLAFPPPVKAPSEGASERPADSFRCAANGDIQIRIRCLLNERCARGQEFRGDVAGLVHSSPGAVDVRDADPDAPDSLAETAEGKMQPPLNV